LFQVFQCLVQPQGRIGRRVRVAEIDPQLVRVLQVDIMLAKLLVVLPSD
jgi:hypothetical protein